MSFLPDWLTGYDSTNAEAAAAADAQLQDMNAVDYGIGGKFYSVGNAAAVDAQRASELASTGGYGVGNQTAAIDQVFTDTLDAEANSIVVTPLGIFWAEVKALLKAVPWWVWVLGLVAVFFWLGGAAFVRRYVSKKAASI